MGFSELIKDIPTTAKVLDVGAYGLGGENTSTELVAHFEDVLTINIKMSDGVELVGDFYKMEFDTLFDLIVLDLNIDNNIAHDWSRGGMERIDGLLNQDGILILYVLTRDGYSFEPLAEEMVKTHLRDYWKSNPVTVDDIVNKLREYQDLFELVATQPCNRRDNVVWVKLRKV